MTSVLNNCNSEGYTKEYGKEYNKQHESYDEKHEVTSNGVKYSNFHISSHLIGVSFIDKELYSMERQKVIKLIEEYINSIVSLIENVFIRPEEEIRFVVNVIKKYIKEEKKDVNLFGLVWCTENLYNVIINKEYYEIDNYLIEQKIEDIKKEKNIKLNKWADNKDDDDEEIDYEELLLAMKNRKQSEVKRDENKSTDDIERELRLQAIEKLKQEKKKKIELTYPESKLFKLQEIKCYQKSCLDRINNKNNTRVDINMVGYDKTMNIRNKRGKSVYEKNIKELEEYISYVSIYDFIEKKTYPVLNRNKDTFRIEFPKQETCFAFNFFRKIIIEKENKKPFIALFETKEKRIDIL